MSIANLLGAIESKSRWLRQDAAGLASYVRQLGARRSFETKAEDALATAEHELVSALETVRAARKHVDALPVNDELSLTA